jgi:hypothetical protein
LLILSVNKLFFSIKFISKTSQSHKTIFDSKLVDIRTKLVERTISTNSQKISKNSNNFKLFKLRKSQIGKLFLSTLLVKFIKSQLKQTNVTKI